MFVDDKKIGKVLLYIKAVDFRKGIYGLSSYVGESLVGEENAKCLFVFCNRTKKKLKVLYWDDTGYALWYKVLETEKFRWPRREEETYLITSEQLKWLLRGLQIEEIKPHKKVKAKTFY